MKFLLLTIGSHGDVHPFVGLGAGLRDRGHDVTLITNGYFSPLARRESLGFIELGTADEYLKTTQNPSLWSKLGGFKAVFDSVMELTERGYPIVADFIQKNPETTVIGSSLALSARVAQDKLHFKMMTVHLQPSVLRSMTAPPRLPGMFMPAWMPNPIKRATWRFADFAVIDPVIAPRLNALRASVGLPPVKRILNDWWNSPDMIVGMFPDWFAKPQVDWPAQTRVTSFPLYDERDHEPMSRELLEFLDAGEAPIAFTAGSAMRFGHSFFEAAVDACSRLGRRGLLLSRHREQMPASLPDRVMQVDYAPFSELLPRCAALVHHGGIGTTAQAMRAGVPQLIMPLTHDQPDNAKRVRKLGIGLEISRSRFTGKSAARKLAALLKLPTVHSRCKTVQNKLAKLDGIAMTCDLGESLAASTLAHARSSK